MFPDQLSSEGHCNSPAGSAVVTLTVSREWKTASWVTGAVMERAHWAEQGAALSDPAQKAERYEGEIYHQWLARPGAIQKVHTARVCADFNFRKAWWHRPLSHVLRQ